MQKLKLSNYWTLKTVTCKLAHRSGWVRRWIKKWEPFHNIISYYKRFSVNKSNCAQHKKEKLKKFQCWSWSGKNTIHDYVNHRKFEKAIESEENEVITTKIEKKRAYNKCKICSKSARTLNAHENLTLPVQVRRIWTVATSKWLERWLWCTFSCFAECGN